MIPLKGQKTSGEEPYDANRRFADEKLMRAAPDGVSEEGSKPVRG
jgi:hypothetical protein